MKQIVEVIAVAEARRRDGYKPGYYDRLRACAGEPVNGRFIVDRHLECYLALPWSIAVTPRGLGDYIAKVTHALGIKPCADCADRQEKWNG